MDFRLGKTREEMVRESDALGRAIERMDEDIDRTKDLLSVFEDFAGWEAFRDKYLRSIRLAQIRKQSAASILETETLRARLRGQCDEIEFLISSKNELDNTLRRLVASRAELMEKRQKVQAKIERQEK